MYAHTSLTLPSYCGVHTVFLLCIALPSQACIHCILCIVRVSDVRQIEIHTVEPLVPDPSPFEVETAIAKSKRYKSPGSDQIPEEMIQAGGETLWSDIHKLINSIWNKEEVPDQWKESVISPIYTKGHKTDCSHYHYCYQLHTKFLSKILLSRLRPHTDEIIGDHQCGFQRNRYTDHIFCILQILG
jgi:hypothetical protein